MPPACGCGQHQDLFLASVWLAVDAIAARGSFLLAMALAARILGPSSFGRLSAVLGTIALLAAFLGDAPRLTAARHIARLPEHEGRARGRVIGLTLIASAAGGALLVALFVVCAPWFASGALAAGELLPALRIAALLLLVEAVGGAQTGILSGLKAFRLQAISGVIGGAALLPLLWLGTAAWGIAGALLGLVLAGAVLVGARAAAIARAMAARGIRLGHGFDRPGLAMLRQFALPTALNSLSWAPVNWLGMVWLVNSPGGYEQMGLYGAASQWFALLIFLPNIVASALLPSLSESAATRSVSAATRAGIQAHIAITLVLSALVILASPLLLRLYGPEFLGGRTALVLVAVAAVPASLINLLSYSVAAHGRMWTLLVCGGAFVAAYLSTAWWLVGLGWGAAGLATAMIAGYSAKLAGVGLALLHVRRTAPLAGRTVD